MFGSFYDPAKIAAAQAAQGKGADGRSVLTGSALLSALNSVAAPKMISGRTAASTNENYQGDLSAAGVRMMPGDGNSAAQYAQDTPASFGEYQSSDGQVLHGVDGSQFGDPNGSYFANSYDNPTGNGDKDKANVTYRIDPSTGQAVPVDAGNSYNPSAWVDGGRFAAMIAATLGTAGVAGGAMAGAGAGAAEGAGAAAGGSGMAGGGASAGASSFAPGGFEFGGGMGAGGGAAGGGAGAAGGAVGGGGGLGASSFAPGGFEFGAGGMGAGGAGAAGAGGSGGSGFLGSLSSGDWGGAASAAGNWATSANGLQTLGGLGSAFMQNRAAGNALDAQTNATNSANALQKYQYDTTRADYAPYRAAGTQAVGQMSNLLANPSSITQDPGYQFGLSQGVQGVDRSAASQGSLYSGATLKALQRYGTDYGTTKLNDSFNRMGSLAQLGASGTAGTAQAGSNYANQAGANTTGLGNAGAGNALYQGNVWGNALNGAVSAYTNPYKP